MKKEIAKTNLEYYANKVLANRAVLLYNVSRDAQREALNEAMKNAAIAKQFYEEVHPIKSRILKVLKIF